MNFNEINTSELISELQNRGYNTNQLWCREDVERILGEINEDKEEDKYVLNEDEMDDILEKATSRESIYEIINENIDYEIRDLLK